MRVVDRFGPGLVAAGTLATILSAAAPARADFMQGVRFTGGIGRTGVIAAIPKNLNDTYAGIEAPDGYTLDWEDLSEVGRWSLRLAMMAPVGSRFHVGAEVFADDLALVAVALKHTGEIPGSTPGETVDAQEFYHRDTWGFAWRVDAEVLRFHPIGGDGPASTRRGLIPRSTVVATGTTGVWRVTDDRLRSRFEEGDAFGWTLGLGWRIPLPGRATLGPSVRYARVFNDRLGRYMTASLEWGWR